MFLMLLFGKKESLYDEFLSVNVIAIDIVIVQSEREALAVWGAVWGLAFFTRPSVTLSAREDQALSCSVSISRQFWRHH